MHGTPKPNRYQVNLCAFMCDWLDAYLVFNDTVS